MVREFNYSNSWHSYRDQQVIIDLMQYVTENHAKEKIFARWPIQKLLWMGDVFGYQKRKVYPVKSRSEADILIYDNFPTEHINTKKNIPLPWALKNNYKVIRTFTNKTFTFKVLKKLLKMNNYTAQISQVFYFQL